MAIVTGKNQRWRVLGAHIALWLLIAVTLFPLLAVLSISLRPGNFSTGIGFHTAQLLWDHTFSTTLSSRAMFSVNRNSINVGGGEVFGLDLNFWNITGRYELSAQLDRHVRANVGMDLTGGPAAVIQPDGTKTLGAGSTHEKGAVPPSATPAAGVAAMRVLRPGSE